MAELPSLKRMGYSKVLANGVGSPSRNLCLSNVPRIWHARSLRVAVASPAAIRWAHRDSAPVIECAIVMAGALVMCEAGDLWPVEG
jgi:hypothetical protein